MPNCERRVAPNRSPQLIEQKKQGRPRASAQLFPPGGRNSKPGACSHPTRPRRREPSTASQAPRAIALASRRAAPQTRWQSSPRAIRPERGFGAQTAAKAGRERDAHKTSVIETERLLSRKNRNNGYGLDRHPVGKQRSANGCTWMRFHFAENVDRCIPLARPIEPRGYGFGTRNHPAVCFERSVLV